MRAKQINNNLKRNIHNDGFGAFIEEIKARNVLLMTGVACEANLQVFGGNFYDYILNELNNIAGTYGLDFTDLSHDNRFLLDPENPMHTRSIYEEIISIIEKNEYSAEEDVSPSLLKLIRTGYFRFVFTTSFDPLVEIAMREQFGEVRVMNIFDKDNRDVISRNDFEIPTIYYLFGKAFSPKEGESFKKFVVTDNDALDVIRRWQRDMYNSLLLQYSSDKYILSLGCNHADWLFRFIWYTLKGDSDKLHRGVIAGQDGSETLSHYLKINNILIDNDAVALVDRIVKSISNDDSQKWENPQRNCDVFISYSREDGKYADALYQSLSSLGLNVWYDRKNLCGNRGGNFMTLLEEAIETSYFFVAILSPSITKQAHEKHVYRREWEWAKEKKQGLTADARCFAAFSSDYDIYKNKYADSLGWLAELDNYQFSEIAPDFSEWAKVINRKILSIKSNGNNK